MNETKSLMPEIPKEMTLSLKEKIATLDMMSWAAMGATLTTFWQILVPFVLYPLNKPQFILGVTSVVFLIISIVVVYWSNNGYQYLKKLAQPMYAGENVIEPKNENPPLPTWHIEGIIYVTSFFLIALYISCLFGILENSGYSTALLQARGIDQPAAIKDTNIIINCQIILILLDIVILAYYVKYSYHLEFYPMHLPCQLGWFLSGFVLMCSVTIGDTEYLPSKIGPLNHEMMEDVKNAHSAIFWECLIGILVTLFFLFEQRSIQQESVPKVRFYFLPFLLLIVIGTMLIIDSITFLYASTSATQSMKSNCKSTIQTFASQYMDSIGCQSKYKIFVEEGNNFYEQRCTFEEVGIVWETETAVKVSDKVNQVSCMDLSCCYLVSEERSLFYKQYFYYAILTAFIGFIGAGHCFDIALQDPQVIKAGPSVYSQTKYVIQIVVACFSVFLGVYMSFKFSIKQPNQLPIFNYSLNLNPSPQYPTTPNVLDSIETCKLLRNTKGEPYKVHFDPTLCNTDRECDVKNQGFKICITSQFAVFQLVSSWQDEDATLVGTNAYNPQSVIDILNGKIVKDQFCAIGLQDAINRLLSDNVYACSTPGKTPTFKFEASQQKVNLKNRSEGNGQQNLMKMVREHTSVDDDDEEQSRAFVSFKLIVQDSESYEYVENADVKVFKNIKKCILLDQSVFYPIREVTTDKKGEAIILHLPVIREQYYNIQVRADGYYYNCQISNSFKLFSVNEYYVPLTRIINKDQSMKLSLWFQNPKIILELGANVIQSDTVDCDVGYYFTTCNDIAYSNKYSSPNPRLSRVITLNKITKSQYLFHVRHLSSDPDILLVSNNKALSLNAQQQNKLKAELKLALESHPIVNVYTRNSLYPISQEPMPVHLTNEIASTPDLLYWLAYCMDGGVGPSSVKAIQHFWEKRDENKFYQRRTSSPQMMPDSTICTLAA